MNASLLLVFIRISNTHCFCNGISRTFVRVINHQQNQQNRNKEIMDNSSHLVFLYGTLKKNEANSGLLQNPDGKCEFIGEAQTLQKWPLVIASRYNIPYLLFQEGTGKRVFGEVYKVDTAMIDILDKIECHPHYYERVTAEVELLDRKCSGESVIKPWIYFLKNFRTVLLELPYFETYLSKGSHGLEYVERYYRPGGTSYYYEVINKLTK